MTAERNQISREKILNGYPSLQNLLDERLLIDIEACYARAKRLEKLPEDTLRMRALSANLREIKKRLRLFKGLVEDHPASDSLGSESRLRRQIPPWHLPV